MRVATRPGDSHSLSSCMLVPLLTGSRGMLSAWNLCPKDEPFASTKRSHRFHTEERYRLIQCALCSASSSRLWAPSFSQCGAELQEVPGPLGMGSRGVDNHSTPQKERGAHAVHKGLLKFAHKVSPMRMAGRGGRSPYHSPSKGF